MSTVRTAKYTRKDRTAIGHEIEVRYIGASDEASCAGIEQIVVFKDGRIEIRMRD